jgi:hypothetical protein
LLPIQLIPYFHYTVSAVIGALLLGYGSWQGGQQGFFGASVAVDPDSDLTPYLIVCWLTVILRGLRRAHAVLGLIYDLSAVRSAEGVALWREAGATAGLPHSFCSALLPNIVSRSVTNLRYAVVAERCAFLIRPPVRKSLPFH